MKEERFIDVVCLHFGTQRGDNFWAIMPIRRWNKKCLLLGSFVIIGRIRLMNY